MSLSFICWLLSFIIICALFGRSMYYMICLEDFAQDALNPFDLASRLNAFVAVEFLLNVVVAALLISTGSWFTGLIMVACVGLMSRQYMLKQLYVSSIDAHRQASQIRWRKGVVFAMHSLAWVMSFFRVIEVGIQMFEKLNAKKMRAAKH